MSRSTFEDILKYLNVYDNLTLDENYKFGRFRPLWLLLNKSWLHAFPKDATVSIDEAMVPYYGRYGAQQHTHGKPIRFGYKVWCLCSRLGYLVQGETYQGASTGNTHPELGVGGSYSIRVAPGPSPKRLKKRVYDDIRLYGLNHVIVKSMMQIRCGECHKIQQ
uniref:PiggyBac transposable element-derived protein domain-containing protein n=1 Tax=Timema poppense TaxID=170557 RepID=A0A7R9HCG1_TIMPO|nr:unnamed protein product [Timema poppensis]